MHTRSASGSCMKRGGGGMMKVFEDKKVVMVYF